MSYLEDGKKLFGCTDPYAWPILLSVRLDALEARLEGEKVAKPDDIGKAKDDVFNGKPKMTVAERMKKAREARGKK